MQKLKKSKWNHLQQKRRCVGSRQIAVNEIDYPETSIGASTLRHLNTNRSPNELMDTSEHASPTSIRRSSRLLERSIRSTRGVSPISICEPAPVLISEPLPKIQDVERQSSFTTLLSDPTLPETICDPTMSTSPKKRTNAFFKSKYSHKGKNKTTSHHHTHGESSRIESMSPLVSNLTKIKSEKANVTLTKNNLSDSKALKESSVFRSVQTQPEFSKNSNDSKNRKSSKHREVKLPENGISMKRKAVMDAISEILKRCMPIVKKVVSLDHLKVDSHLSLHVIATCTKFFTQRLL